MINKENYYSFSPPYEDIYIKKDQNHNIISAIENELSIIEQNNINNKSEDF